MAPRKVMEFLVLKIFRLLSWPSFALLCPLCASLWVAKSNSFDLKRQCLAFWILFGVVHVFEQAMENLPPKIRIPYWFHIKGVATVLLTIPYFIGAYNVYINFVSPFFFETSSDTNSMRNERLSNGNESNNLDDNEDFEEFKNLVFQETACEIEMDWTDNSLQQYLLEIKQRNEERAGEIEQKSNVTTGFSLSGLIPSDIWHGFIPKSLEIRWEKPDHGWIKLNTDGSGGGNACFAGLLRDSKGHPLRAFVCKTEESESFVVEMLAIWRGLQLALSMRVKLLWVESDCQSAVRTINKEQSYTGIHDECLKQIWKRMKKFKTCRVTHCYREANKAADFLSKMDSDESDVVLERNQFPNRLWKIIKEDAKGKTYRRRKGWKGFVLLANES